MVYRKIEYLGLDFIVQSFKENEFANICECNGDSFMIDFVNKKIDTSTKEHKRWKEIASKINFDEIHAIILDKLK